MNPITVVVTWVKLRPILNREKDIMRMKLTTSTLCQLLLGGCDIVNVVTPLLHGNAKVYAGAALAILHVMVNTIAHLSTIDGKTGG